MSTYNPSNVLFLKPCIGKVDPMITPIACQAGTRKPARSNCFCTYRLQPCRQSVQHYIQVVFVCTCALLRTSLSSPIPFGNNVPFHLQRINGYCQGPDNENASCNIMGINTRATFWSLTGMESYLLLRQLKIMQISSFC